MSQSALLEKIRKEYPHYSFTIPQLPPAELKLNLFLGKKYAINPAENSIVVNMSESEGFDFRSIEDSVGYYGPIFFGFQYLQVGNHQHYNLFNARFINHKNFTVAKDSNPEKSDLFVVQDLELPLNYRETAYAEFLFIKVQSHLRKNIPNYFSLLKI